MPKFILSKVEGIKIYSKKLFLIIISLAVCGLGFFQNVFAVGEDSLVVTSIHRITHQAHGIADVFSGDENTPWNQDNTRILLYEGSTNHPNYPTARSGKGLLWGRISELKAAANGTVESWEAVAHPLANSSSVYGGYAAWSRISGETNIIYAINRSSKMLVRIDTDTSIVTNVISVNSGGSQPNLGTQGWTSDTPSRLIVGFDHGEWSGGFYEISGLPNSPVKTYYASWPGSCTSNSHRFSVAPKAIHQARSPDKQYTIKYSGSSGGNDGAYINAGVDCNPNQGDGTSRDYIDWNPKWLTHMSWQVNEWFVGANAGDHFFSNGNNGPNPAPHIETFSIEQVIFDRTTHQFTHNLLLSVSNAAFRWTTVPWYGGDMNYIGGIPSPTLRNDGNQLHYAGTDGHYSQEDKAWCDYMGNPSPCSQVQADYVMPGIFLADLAPASGIQTCTSFNYSAWGTCQSDGIQTRTVTSSSPSGCTGGDPVLTQSCIYPDINSDTHVNIKDIQACIKVITNSQTDTNIIARCNALAAPDLMTNIKDIQVIIREIIN